MKSDVSDGIKKGVQSIVEGLIASALLSVLYVFFTGIAAIIPIIIVTVIGISMLNENVKDLSHTTWATMVGYVIAMIIAFKIDFNTGIEMAIPIIIAFIFKCSQIHIANKQKTEF